MGTWFAILSILSQLGVVTLSPCWQSDACAPDDVTCDELLTLGTVQWKQSVVTQKTRNGLEKVSASEWHSAQDYCKVENGPWVYESTCEVYKEFDVNPSVFVAKTCPKGTVCSLGKCIEPTKCADPDNDVAYSKNAQYFTKNSVTETKGDNPPGPPVPDKCLPTGNNPQLLAEKICVAIPGGAKLDTEYVDCAKFNATCNNGACICTTGDCKLPCVDYIGPTELSKFQPFSSCQDQMPPWVGTQQIQLMQNDGELDTDNDLISNPMEICRTRTLSTIPDTDGDGFSDNNELLWQTHLQAYDGSFHPEHHETNPLLADTDQDGVGDALDACPLNAVTSCKKYICTPPALPAWTCTQTIQHQEPMAVFAWDEKQPFALTDQMLHAVWASQAITVLFDASPSIDFSALPLNDFATTDGVRLYRSTDEGATWALQAQFPLTEMLGPSPDDAQHEMSHLSSDVTGTILRGKALGFSIWSDDEGQTWEMDTDPNTHVGFHISPDGKWLYELIGDTLQQHPFAPWSTSSNQAITLGIFPEGIHNIDDTFDGEQVWVATKDAEGNTYQAIRYMCTGTDDCPQKTEQWITTNDDMATAADAGVNNTIVTNQTYGNIPILFPSLKPTDPPATSASIPPGGIPYSPRISADGTIATVLTAENTLWVSTVDASSAGAGDVWHPVTLPGVAPEHIVVGPDGKTMVGISVVKTDQNTATLFFTKITCP